MSTIHLTHNPPYPQSAFTHNPGVTTTTTPLTLTTIARSRVPDHRRLRLLPALALLWHQPLEVRLHGRWERGHWTPQVTRDQGLGARRRQVLPREARQHRIPRLDRSQIVLLTLSSLIVAGLTSNHTPRILHQSCTKKTFLRLFVFYLYLLSWQLINAKVDFNEILTVKRATTEHPKNKNALILN